MTHTNDHVHLYPVVLALLLLALGLGTENRGFAQNFPPGWILSPTPRRDSDKLVCANYSQREWLVSVSGTTVAIVPVPSATARGNRSRQEFPSGVQRQKGMVGRQSSLQLRNGLLLGFDGGEFGGGLWFASESGTTQELSGENVRGLIAIPKGVLILTGLAHLGSDHGAVYMLPDSVASPSDLELLAKLDGAPQAFTKTSDDVILVVTTQGVSRISSSGISDAVLHRDFGLLYPNSITSLPDGSIYIGMRLFVVRLTPQSGEYLEQWMLPQNCKHVKIRGINCVCKN